MALTEVAKEAKLPGSRSTIKRAIYSRGYGRYSVQKKPYLSQNMCEKRLAWATKHRDWELSDPEDDVQVNKNSGFNRVYFTDETFSRLDEVKGRQRCTRLLHEVWDDDCTDKTFGINKGVGLMFHSGIAYN